MPRVSRCGSLAACVVLVWLAPAGAQDRAREAAAALVSGSGNAAAFTERLADPPAVPEERRREIGGIAINARNNAPWPAPDIGGITVARLDAPDAGEFRILAPFDTTLGWLRFSPDGAWLSYVVIRDTGVEQWVAEIASGIPRPLTSASLNAAWGEPCRWLADSSGMLCRFVMSARGSPPDDETPSSTTTSRASSGPSNWPPGAAAIWAHPACSCTRSPFRAARNCLSCGSGSSPARTPPRANCSGRSRSSTWKATRCAGSPTCRRTAAPSTARGAETQAPADKA